MKALDYYLQRRRVEVALGWIRPGSRVLDVGSADGALFRLGRDRIASGVGLDTVASDATLEGPYELRTGAFPDAVGADEQFDAVVMLAVVEHVRDDELERWAAAIPKIVRPAGRLIITTPSPLVDAILEAGIKLRLLDGMEVHQHHGFDPRTVPVIFSVDGVRLEARRRFELGLNHLFVFAVGG
jgi:2-polyprenyl-3-methyl-5-hydroxy-6-metoxy-1,4-benzoquinol methylase